MSTEQHQADTYDAAAPVTPADYEWPSAAQRLANLKSDIARTDTVILRDLHAGFTRVGTPACLESAALIAAEIQGRTDRKPPVELVSCALP